MFSNSSISIRIFQYLYISTFIYLSINICVVFLVLTGVGNETNPRRLDFVGFDLAHAEAETVWVLVSVYRFYFVQLNRFANLL